MISYHLNTPHNWPQPCFEPPDHVTETRVLQKKSQSRLLPSEIDRDGGRRFKGLLHRNENSPGRHHFVDFYKERIISSPRQTSCSRYNRRSTVFPPPPPPPSPPPPTTHPTPPPPLPPHTPPLTHPPPPLTSPPPATPLTPPPRKWRNNVFTDRMEAIPLLYCHDITPDNRIAKSRLLFVPCVTGPAFDMRYQWNMSCGANFPSAWHFSIACFDFSTIDRDFVQPNGMEGKIYYSVRDIWAAASIACESASIPRLLIDEVPRSIPKAAWLCIVFHFLVNAKRREG